MSLDEMNSFLHLLLNIEPADIHCLYLCKHKADADGMCEYEECKHVDDLHSILIADYDLVNEKLQEASNV